VLTEHLPASALAHIKACTTHYTSPLLQEGEVKLPNLLLELIQMYAVETKMRYRVKVRVMSVALNVAMHVQ
jgi:hypothetical protein